MAGLEHLHLVRLPERFERRKRPGFGKPPARTPRDHSAKLGAEVEAAIGEQIRRRRPTVDPSLILRVKLSAAIPDEEWQKLGLTVLSADADRSLVLFSSSDELTEFRRRIVAYGQPLPKGQKNPQYNGFVGTIDSIGSVEPKDRIGRRLRAKGYTDVSSFSDQPLLVDVELWEIGDHSAREVRLFKIKFAVEAEQGEVLDQYNGPAISALRLRISGNLLADLLSIDDVASIDLPPEPDLQSARVLETTLPNTPSLNEVTDEHPVVGIIDSGVSDHPLLKGTIVAAIAEPDYLDTHDGQGHGTLVAGIATFGDLRERISEGMLTRVARIASGKVLNDKGEFDDRSYVPKQMRRAITRLNAVCGCRIFVLSLGHADEPFDGKKVGPWAQTLDELARELDILIVVSAGNRRTINAEFPECWASQYPHYLTDADAAFCEPAGAMNVVTVGSLAHGPGTEEAHEEDVKVRFITECYHPSPFTRVGPGVGGATKPDLVDFGGTLVYDAFVNKVRGGKDVAAAGMLSLYHKPVERLFASSSGTSMAAPMVAFKAAQLLRQFPKASANLLRALLISGASVPEESTDVLACISEHAPTQVCGHGLVNVQAAARSDENRVVLYAEDALSFDYFAVYDVPIPPDYQKQKGRRQIRVTLAFDPPVRHRRADYLGTTMDFRLVRGCSADLVLAHYRKRASDEGRHPDLPSKYNCQLTPGPSTRDKCTVQTGVFNFEKDASKYGDTYYVVVRCEAGWANSISAQEQRQRYSLVVELRHSAPIQLYQQVQLRQRLRQRV